MHSGNIGHAQDLDTLVRAATFLRDLDRLRIMVIGFGARHGELTRLAQRLEVTRAVHFLDYQPREQLPLSLATADLHYVGLARGLAGFVVPSRLYGILAAGRPVLVAADEESETVCIVRGDRVRSRGAAGACGARGGRDPRPRSPASTRSPRWAFAEGRDTSSARLIARSLSTATGSSSRTRCPAGCGRGRSMSSTSRATE